MVSSTITGMELLPPIRSPDLSRPEIGPPFCRLNVQDVAQMFDVMLAAAAPGVMPPDISLSLEDAARLFVPPEQAELEPALGVFGYFDDGGRLVGFLALSELELDGESYVEFYIFFRPVARRRGLAADGADRLTRLASSLVAYPICTLIYAENQLGKKFYAKVGFHFERTVSLDGMDMEMWRWHGRNGDEP